MFEWLKTIGEATISIFQSLVNVFLKIPKIFQMVNVGTSMMLSLFNQLPSWLFVCGSVTIAVCVIWIIIEII